MNDIDQSMDEVIGRLEDYVTLADFNYIFEHLHPIKERMYLHGYIAGRFEVEYDEFFQSWIVRYAEDYNLGYNDGKGDKADEFCKT